MARTFRNKREFLESTLERFWTNVEKRGPDECWPWRGNIALPNKCGQRYGKFTFYDGKTINYRAHRFAWTVTNGRIPAGFVVMHSCDVPHCVNPAHLRAATQAENLADRDRKGRAALGSRQGASKLTEPEVQIIKKSDDSCAVLGRRFGVHATTIMKIKQGVNWKHVH